MQTLTPNPLSKEEYDQLLLEKDNLLQEKDRVICELQAQVKKLSEQVAELSARLSKDSRNSSKPPSSDGLSKQNKTKSTRESSGRKPGGQPGHKGHTLEFSKNPDHIENHFVKECSQCGANLEGVEQKQINAHQVFDIPPPSRVEVTEHSIFRIQCPYCHHINESCFPEGVEQPVQYGFEIRSRLIYLSQYQLLPIKRVKEMMKDLHDTSLSMGTVQNTIMNLAQKLKAPVENIKKALCREAVAGFDESGYRVNKQLQWLHVASTPKLVWYGIHKKRGEEAMNDQGILPNFTGTAVHDGWKPYKAFTNCSHALCNAHHLRELIFVVETKEQIWAAKMIELLIQGNEEVRKAKEEARPSLPQERIEYYRSCYLAILDEGDIQNPIAPKTPGKRGRTKQSYEVNLLGRLREGIDEVLRFMSDFRVPFTNNETERDVRMPKAKLKISGCMRSDEGAEAFCTIRSYLATLKKQGHSLIQALVEAFCSTPPEPYYS